jgi:hypothetical protein
VVTLVPSASVTLYVPGTAWLVGAGEGSGAARAGCATGSARWQAASIAMDSHAARVLIAGLSLATRQLN